MIPPDRWRMMTAQRKHGGDVRIELSALALPQPLRVTLGYDILGGRVAVRGEQLLRHRVDRLTDVSAQFPKMCGGRAVYPRWGHRMAGKGLR